MLCLLHFAKRFSAQACFLTLHVPSVDVTFTIFFSCCRCFCYLRYQYISVLDTPLINKITNKETNQKDYNKEKRLALPCARKKTRILKNTKTKHLKALLTHPVKYLSFFYSCLRFLKQEEKNKDIKRLCMVGGHFSHARILSDSWNKTHISLWRFTIHFFSFMWRQPDTVNRWPVFDVGRLDLSV